MALVYAVHDSYNLEARLNYHAYCKPDKLNSHRCVYWFLVAVCKGAVTVENQSPTYQSRACDKLKTIEVPRNHFQPLESK